MTPKPSAYTLFHGTSYNNFLGIIRGALKAPSHLSANETVARNYSGAFAKPFGGTPRGGVRNVIIEFSGIPALWLRYDSRSMSETVPSDRFTGAQMDYRASHALGQFKRRHPEFYNAERKTCSVPEEFFQLSLNAISCVKCVEMLPAAFISRVKFIGGSNAGVWFAADQLPSSTHS